MARTAAALLLSCGAARGDTPPPPVLTTTNFSRGAFAAPAFLTNGFIGIRPGPIPLVADPFSGTTAPSGFDPTVPATVAGFMYRDVSLHEVLAPGPYPFATAVLLDGTDLLRATGARAVPLSQTLDMACGELTTHFELSSGGVRVALNSTMFVSRSLPTVAAMRVTAAITSPGRHRNLTLAPALSLSPKKCRSDTGQPNGVGADCTVPAAPYNSTIPGPTMPGWAAWVWDKDIRYLGAVTNLGSRVGVAAKPNLTTTEKGVTYEVLVSVVSSAVSGEQDPVLAAYEHVERAAYLGGDVPFAASPRPSGGFATLRRRNREAWAELWQARPVVRGADAGAIAADQRMIDTAFFYMHSHAHPDSTMGVADYGLSQT